MNYGLSVDGNYYRVIVSSAPARAFEIMEGKNNGLAISGREIPDVIGTKYAYSMVIEPDTDFPEDYDALYHLISAPVNSHTVVMPYGQSTIQFDARILSGNDNFTGVFGEVQRWRTLNITFKPIQPQRT